MRSDPRQRPRPAPVTLNLSPWLTNAIADVFVEVQRADTKATTLCAVAGGLAAVTVALASQHPMAGALSTCLLYLGGGLQVLASAAAVAVLRPSAQSTGSLFLPSAGRTVAEVVAAEARSAEDTLHVAAERYVMLSLLARRKFRLLRWAVDALSAAVVTTTIAVLLAWIGQ